MGFKNTYIFSVVTEVAVCHFKVQSQGINQSESMDIRKRNTYSSILTKQTAGRKMVKVNIFQLFLKKFQLHFEISDSIKVKMCLIIKQQAMEMYRGVEVQLHHSGTRHQMQASGQSEIIFC
jgi:hypothetical protein